ncbi:MAG: hypothetical protein EXQ83_11505 [Xanthobacteraceae bacterium]|nr:hypothetical protein [Xanthobacteraceae bacterium]
MSTTTNTPASPGSVAASATFRTFAVVLAIATPVIYTICEMRNWPLFTYHPGINRVDFGWAAAVRDQGPAMYWYGWIANTLIGSAVLGFIATMLPENATRRIPLSLVWILPIVMIPILVYALRFFWRW